MVNVKILFVVDNLVGEGAQKLMSDLLPLMNGDRYTCDLLILTDKGQKYLDSLRGNGIKVDVVPAACNGHIKRIRYIKKYIADGRYDIVHANLFPVTYYCSLIKRMSGKKFPHLVMTEHNTDNRRRHHKILRPIEKIIYNAYERVISISEPVQQELMKWLKISGEDKRADKFVVIHNGIPIEQFGEARAYSKQELFPSVKDGDILLCMVGSFTEQKNHVGMLKIMEQLPERYKLLLVGEGELFNEIKAEAARLHLDYRIAFLGFRRDVAEIMHTADIVVIPSKWEGFGLIAAEAMACGKPIVASNVCGLAEVVGNAGITADCSNIGEFAQTILRMEDMSLYSDCQTNAVQRVKSFSIARMCNEYNSVFKSLFYILRGGKNNE